MKGVVSLPVTRPDQNELVYIRTLNLVGSDPTRISCVNIRALNPVGSDPTRISCGNTRAQTRIPIVNKTLIPKK